MSSYKKRVDGYFAASIVIEEMLHDAKEKLEPRAKREGMSKDWWQGHYEGLLAAHCFMALGQFPDVPHNKEKIKEMLDSESKK